VAQHTIHRSEVRNIVAKKKGQPLFCSCGSPGRRTSLRETTLAAQDTSNSVGNNAVRSVQHTGAQAPFSTNVDGAKQDLQPSSTSGGTPSLCTGHKPDAHSTLAALVSASSMRAVLFPRYDEPRAEKQSLFSYQKDDPSPRSNGHEVRLASSERGAPASLPLSTLPRVVGLERLLLAESLLCCLQWSSFILGGGSTAREPSRWDGPRRSAGSNWPQNQAGSSPGASVGRWPRSQQGPDPTCA